MKNRNITALALTLLVFFSLSSNFVAAQSSSYIGISSGEEYIWTVTVDQTAADSILSDMGYSGSPIETSQTMPSFDDYLSINSLKLTIDNIISGMSNPSGAMVYCDLEYTTVENSNWVDIISEMGYPSSYYIPLIDPSESNYFIYISSSLYLLVGVGVNWNQLASDFNDFYPTGYNMVANSDGYSMSLSSSLTGLSSTILYTLAYGTNGVLSTATMLYGGITVASLTLGGAIPGYPVVILLGVSLVGALSLIMIHKRKIN